MTTPTEKTPTENSSADSANKGADDSDTSASAKRPNGDETNPTVAVDSSVVIPQVVLEDETERVADNPGSGLQDADTSGTASHKDTLTAGTNSAARTIQTGGDTTDSGATAIVVSHIDTSDESDTETHFYTLDIDLSQQLSVSVEPDNQTLVTAQSAVPDPSGTPKDIVTDLLSAVGLGLPASATDGPVAPSPAVLLMASLDFVRRDLEQMSDDQLIVDPQQDTADTLIVEEPSNDSGPVALTTAAESQPEPPSSLVPRDLTLDPTSAERTTAFQKAQAKRIETFNEAQAARIEAFNEQLASQSAENPLGALVGSAAFVVSELVNTAAVVVTEFVNYISFAVSEFIQGLSDWFTAPAVFTGLYGDPTTNAQYWQAQSSQNCVLMSAAMVIGQLTGTTPSEEEIVAEAVATASVANPGQKMYQGLQSQDGVDVKDAVKLLENHGIRATLTKYDKSEGNLALRALAFALDEKKAVSVGLHGGTIWSAVDNEPLPQGASAADHQVVVTGVDFTERVVYLNDSGFAEQGKNMKVPLDAFMKAWQTDDYETIIAELKDPNTAAGPASTNISGSGVLVSVA